MTTKASLVNRIAAQTGFTKAASAELLDLVHDLTLSDLKEAGVALLPGIGKIKVVDRPARTGRNPRTGEAMEIPARKAAKLRPTSGLTADIQ
jgi:DNA-binding protein HU-beta